MSKTLPGLEAEFSSLAELLYLTISHSAEFAKLKTAPPRGILLYGPPGVGKTMLVKQISALFELPVVSVLGSEIASPYIGEAEKQLLAKFAEAHELSKNGGKPAILFIDELYFLCSGWYVGHDRAEQGVCIEHGEPACFCAARSDGRSGSCVFRAGDYRRDEHAELYRQRIAAPRPVRARDLRLGADGRQAPPHPRPLRLQPARRRIAARSR
ncbi:Protein CdcH [Smittium culicis]|uniref:Protein CdcH n=1 Tax=Smittium culicis TaxID=133412 RepID=A0A1R1XZJ8_9FUNG|nr:Protein CdcH [Smittium culicis]